MDEVAICKPIEYDVTQFCGYVDHETGNGDNDCRPLVAVQVLTECFLLGPARFCDTTHWNSSNGTL